MDDPFRRSYSIAVSNAEYQKQSVRYENATKETSHINYNHFSTENYQNESLYKI